MIRLTENIENDLKRWDKLGFIVVSASISTTEHLLDDDGNVIKDENGEPVNYLTDQYLNSADVIYGDKKGLDNGQRTNKLKQEIKDSGFSYKKVWGVYDGGKEDSFMIFPIKVSDGEVQEVDFSELYEFGKDLVKDFTQYSVHVHKPGTGVGGVTNDNYKGDAEMTFKNTRGSTKDDPFATSTVNPKKPSALRHSFSTDYVSENGANHKLTDRDFEEVFSKSNLDESLFGKKGQGGYQIAKKFHGEWVCVDAFGKCSRNDIKTYEIKANAEDQVKAFQRRFPDDEFKVVDSNDEFRE